MKFKSSIKKDRAYAQKLVVDKRPEHQQCHDTFGFFVIQSIPWGWSIENIVTTYHGLNDIEQIFQALKSDLQLRP
ncbi:MAG: hypothetical protein OXE77_09680 [Flavobacteriaceae bacterium]|nr:hypothetical protein [Flavobacteriaceae bacterium]MCY4267770.1 hypothetical protein [Flavobacteriaceae bacterium]MCY4298545.1 hypothetical protein [Flavobacteriaceae bacterium]